MGLTTTNALCSVQDGAGAVSNIANGANALVTEGAQITVALQSATGVQSWILQAICPAYPGLHQRSFYWQTGAGPSTPFFQIPLPAEQVSGTNVQSGIQFISTVSDGLQSIASAYFFLQTRGWNTVPSQHWVRAVQMAALAAYTNVNGVLTENANGAISTADGVTLAVGDLILLPNGIAASAVDAGVYQVTSLGGASAKWVLTASPDWQIGMQVMPKTEVLVSEGTVMGGTTWVVTNTGLTNLVGTASFTFYPRAVSQSVTLVAGTTTISNVPVLSATKTLATAERTTANTSTATTGGYNTIGGKTAGALGTASIVFDACVAAGTINNADVSTLCVTVINPV